MEGYSLSNTFIWEFKESSKTGFHSSDVFYAIGHKWCIIVERVGTMTGYLSIRIRVVAFKNLSHDWSICAKFSLSVINRINSKLTRSKEAQHNFNAANNELVFTNIIPISKLYDPKEGYLVNGIYKIKAVVAVPSSDYKRKREATPYLEIPPLRTSPIAPPPTNATKPSSTLKKRSTIARTILQGFMSEFEEDFPTCEKFGKVMEDLRSTMYGGNMGDIFEEWRPRILEIEALLGDIEDMERQSEAPLRETLSKIKKSMIQFRRKALKALGKSVHSRFTLDQKQKELDATLRKCEELKGQIAELESEVDKGSSEKLEAEKEIEKLKKQKQDVTTNIEDVRAGAEERKMVIAEKKATVLDWFSSPLPP